MYICSKCKSVNQDDAYKSDGNNFIKYTVERLAFNVIPTPETTRIYHICKECDPAFNASLVTILLPLQ